MKPPDLLPKWQPTSLFILALTPMLTMGAPAVAKTFKGKCYNHLEKDFDPCKIKTSKKYIEIRFRTKENRRADQLIPARRVTAISSGKRVRGRLKSLSRGILRSRFSPLPLLGKIGLGIVPGLSKRKSRKYLVEYQEESGEKNAAVFRVKKDYAKKLTKELKRRTKVDVD